MSLAWDRRVHAKEPTEPVAGSRAIEQRAADWLARRDGGGWTGADAAALEAWLDAEPGHRVAFLRLEAGWRELGRLQALGAGISVGPPPRGHWRWTGPVHPGASLRPGPAPAGDGPHDLRGLVFASRRLARARAPRARRTAALAAALFLAATLGNGLRHQAAGDASSHATAIGELQSLPLADGSHTLLGSGSRIQVRLTPAERRIELDRGEAIFDAARDPGRPFIVLAGERRVVAIGTRFSVRRDGPDLRVVVTEGRVRLESAPGADGQRAAALLPAGSVATATAEGVLVRVGPLEAAERLVGWQDGMLAFRDTPLAEAAAEFNRWNTRPIVLADAEAGALLVGGSFRWSNAEGFARLLEQAFPVQAEYSADRIVLRSAPAPRGISAPGSSR